MSRAARDWRGPMIMVMMMMMMMMVMTIFWGVREVGLPTRIRRGADLGGHNQGPDDVQGERGEEQEQGKGEANE